MSTKTKTDVAVTDASLPPMVHQDNTGGMNVGDMATPMVYFLQGMSGIVKEGYGREGQVVLALNSTDADFTYLIEDPAEDFFTAYVFCVEKKAGFYEPDGIRYTDDLNIDRNNPEHHDKWIIWDYTVAIPAADDFLPVRMRMQKTAGQKAARSINSLTARAVGAVQFGEIHDPVAIKVSFKKATGSRGHTYYAPQVGPMAATPDGLAVATQIADRFRVMQASRHYENDAPVEDHVDQPEI